MFGGVDSAEEEHHLGQGEARAKEAELDLGILDVRQ